MLFLAAIGICRRKDLVKGFFISGFTVAIVFSPWLAVTCRQFILRMRYDDGSTAELATLNSVMDYFKEWFSAVETPIGIVVLLGMALWTGYASIIMQLRPSRQRRLPSLESWEG